VTNRASWIAPLYGYVVCVIAVVTFLISASGFVDAAFERSAPLMGRGGAYGPMGSSLGSFEAFRASYVDRKMMERRPGDPMPTDTLSTDELRKRYEALRADRIAQMSYSASQRLVKHGLLILLAIVLFVTHWRWLRRQHDTTP
jgi:hypothetical protein